MLPEKDIEKRFAYFMEKFRAAVDMPLPVAIMVQQFVPQVPKLLNDPDKQEELLDLLQLICWVMGYRVSYEDETIDLPVAEEETGD